MFDQMVETSACQNQKFLESETATDVSILAHLYNNQTAYQTLSSSESMTAIE